ncbi:MAG: type I restriction enzyme HsdR N-terminal domain-containing protein [Clostridium sp.]|nr:type I restriction enzyme HsdR N-terminal domain-containing protein [Clostridium sp.]
MEFSEKIEQLKERAISLKDSLQTEEATKNALVMPFLNTLGYDVFNPLEVVPEFVADSRLKKDEKVDYAVMQDGKPIILIECKKVDNDKLDVKKHAGQLFKYFTACKAKFIILTNGIVYKFFSDIEETNVLDKEPFFTFNLFEYKENQLETLSEFCKENFDLEKAYSNAGDLKYIRQFEEVIENEYRNPSDDFVRYLLDKSEIYDGVKTAKVIEKHRKTTVEAFNLFMSKVMKTSLDFSLTSKQDEKEKKNQVVTTLEELEGYAIVKSILNGNIDLNRVTYRDNASYCNVLLDDNIRKTLCRLYFNRSQKYIAFLEGTREQKQPIQSINEIYKFSDILKAKVAEIEKEYAQK